MAKIWEFFENLGEMVYVADMDSYELVYMNKKALKTYGYSSLDEMVGKKCYQVLQGSSLPCTVCNSQELRQGQFKEWHQLNPLLGKYFLVKETMVEEGGRRYRMEIALDVSSEALRDDAAERHQSLEALVNEALRIALQASTPDQSINIILEYLGKALKGQRTYIFERNEAGHDDNTYEWVADGIIPEKENLQNLPPEVCANWYQHFEEGKFIQINHIEDIRESEPLQYEILKRQNISSLVVVPLYDKGRTIAFYGVDNPPENSLTDASNLLKIMGHFLVSTLKQRNLIKQLQLLSYYDQLTKFGNRHAMDAYLEKTVDNDSIGVVYCDVTGLKQVNDTQGHAAGDMLIIRACESIKKVFAGNSFFRMGGDELLVMCKRITKEELEEKVKELEKVTRENAVVLAVGSCWSQYGSQNINHTMMEAEQLMYQNKRLYYQNRGTDRRKQ